MKCLLEACALLAVFFFTFYFEWLKGAHMCMSLNYNKTHNERAANKSDDNIEFDHFAIVALLYFVVVVVSFLLSYFNSTNGKSFVVK